MTKHYLLYGHGGSYNHGGEALARSTIALLRRVSAECRITLSTHFADQDREFALPADEFVERNPLGGSNGETYAPTLARITPGSVCIHIGGDNYCYRNWERWALIHYKSLERGARSILWSCSIEPKVITPEMLQAFRTHHVITAREGITYETLLSHGLTNVVKVSDIAFTLQAEAVDATPDNFVVLNVSPLVMRKNALVLPAYQVLLDYILRQTNMNVMLLPHVMQAVDNDYDALKMLDTHGSNRVVLVSDQLSAAQYKYIVGKSRFCVTARTHVSIAAYASLVPTLVIGYSVKSRGIALDLGMSDHVLGIEQIQDDSAIVGQFEILMDNETAIRAALEKEMPQYKQLAVPGDIF